MYGFYEGMIVTMDLGNPDIEQDNMDIWVLVDTFPILPQYEFLKECAEDGRQNPLHRWLRINLSGEKSSDRILY